MTFTGSVSATVVVPSGITVSATNGGGGPTAVTWTAGTYESPTAALAALVAALQATRPPSGDAWTGTLSLTTGLVTLDCPTDTWALTWTSTDARDFLGYAGNISSGTTAQTATKQCRGLWIPDRPFNCDGNHKAIPPVTDLRSMRSPTGLVISHSGNVHYRHRNVRWMNVDVDRVWRSDETTENASLEQWLMDTQWGLGHDWFTTSSKCIVIAHDGVEVGNGSVAGWYMLWAPDMEGVATRAVERWNGQWGIACPEIVSDS